LEKNDEIENDDAEKENSESNFSISEDRMVYTRSADMPKKSAPTKHKKRKSKKTYGEEFILNKLIPIFGTLLLLIGIGLYFNTTIKESIMGILSVGHEETSQNTATYDLSDIIGKLSGFLLGIIMVAFSLFYRKRKSRQFLSLVLCVTGILAIVFNFIVLFLQQWFPNPFHNYIIIFIITSAIIYIALLYKNKEIAAIAVMGKFLMLFFSMWNNGYGTFTAYLTFELITAIGFAIVSNVKRWNLINFANFFLVTLMYAKWLYKRVLFFDDQVNFQIAIIFSTLLFVVFLVSTFPNFKKDFVKQNKTDVLVLFFNILFYSVFTIITLYKAESFYLNPLYCWIFGIILIYLGLRLYKNSEVFVAAPYILFGFSYFMFSLALSLLIKQNYFIIFTSVALIYSYWFSKISQIKTFKLFSFIFLICTFVYFAYLVLLKYLNLMLLDESFSISAHEINFNFLITGILTAFVIFLNILFIDVEKRKTITIDIPKKIYKQTLISFFLFVTYTTSIVLIFYNFPQQFTSNSYSDIVFYFFNIFFFFLSLSIIKKHVSDIYLKIYIALAAFTILVYPISSNYSNINAITEYLFGGTTTIAAFVFHYLNVGFIIATLFLLMKMILERFGYKSLFMDIFWLFGSLMILFIISSEMYYIAMFIGKNRSALAFDAYMLNVIKIGFPVLWSVSSFVFLLIGIIYRIRIIRIIAMLIFIVTIIKLFAYDISDLSNNLKVLMFILIGGLLLSFSFLYKKIFRTLFESEDKN